MYVFEVVIFLAGIFVGLFLGVNLKELDNKWHRFKYRWTYKQMWFHRNKG